MNYFEDTKNALYLLGIVINKWCLSYYVIEQTSYWCIWTQTYALGYEDTILRSGMSAAQPAHHNVCNESRLLWLKIDLLFTGNIFWKNMVLLLELI
jgi:hypothetical protein